MNKNRNIINIESKKIIIHLPNNYDINKAEIIMLTNKKINNMKTGKYLLF